MLKIGFVFDGLINRGVTLSTLFFAKRYEILFPNSSYIFLNTGDCDPILLNEINNYFNNIYTIDFQHDFKDVDVVYYQYDGSNFNFKNSLKPFLHHYVFQNAPTLLNNTFYVSEWLSLLCTANNISALPLPVNTSMTIDSYREEFGIPESAIVCGRIGGLDSFDLNFVREVLKSNMFDVYFIFASTDNIPLDTSNRIFILDKLYGNELGRFYNTLDYFLHARYRGESCGMALTESMLYGVKNICWHGGIDRNHLNLSSINYYGKVSLKKILLNLKKYDKKKNNKFRTYNEDCFNKFLASIELISIPRNKNNFTYFKNRIYISFIQKIYSLYSRVLLIFSEII